MVNGTTNIPITKPIIITVEEIASMLSLLFNNKAKESKKQIPQIKDNLDKNNSRRIGDFRLK